MQASAFDNLPALSKEEALLILEQPVDQLTLSSDYYKAVFHLSKYPGNQTEQALLSLVETESKEQAIVIARRKAVEGLARLGCKRAIPSIGHCLRSSDPYLVENAAWALQELGCKDSELHKEISCLLDDPNQNRRVLIQSLAKMKAVKEVSRIKLFINDLSASPGIRGASIAAVANLIGDSDQIGQLKEYLFLSNQNDRQCAVQDVIDAGDIDLLSPVLKSPVAPSFRIRAINALWPEDSDVVNGMKLIPTLDSILEDNPNNLRLVHSYNHRPTNQFLIEELFGTDFSRCYLALKTIICRNPREVWQDLSIHLERIKRDYGALYFFIILFKSVVGWEKNALIQIEDLLISAIDIKWPDFMKFRPVAIASLMAIDSGKYLKYLIEWLDEEQTPFWACRYAALMSVESLLPSSEYDSIIKIVKPAENDSHRFVRKRAQKVILK